MSEEPASSDTRAAVILAAGQGKRMRSRRPKVLHEVAGKALLAHVVAAARAVRSEPVVVVFGHGGEEVQAAFAGDAILWAEQTEQRGTGDALARAEEVLGATGRLVLVLSGDVPLVTPATLERLAAAASAGWGAMAVATLDDPGNLGRVFAGPFVALGSSPLAAAGGGCGLCFAERICALNAAPRSASPTPARTSISGGMPRSCQSAGSSTAPSGMISFAAGSAAGSRATLPAAWYSSRQLSDRICCVRGWPASQAM